MIVQENCYRTSRLSTALCFFLALFVLAPAGCGRDEPESGPEHQGPPSVETPIDFSESGPWLELGQLAHDDLHKKPYMRALYTSRFIPQYLVHGDSAGYEKALAKFEAWLNEPEQAGQRWLPAVRSELIKKLGEAEQHAEVIRVYRLMDPDDVSVFAYAYIMVAVHLSGDMEELDRVLALASSAAENILARALADDKNYGYFLSRYAIGLIKIGRVDLAMQYAKRSDSGDIEKIIAELLYEQDDPASAKRFAIFTAGHAYADDCWLELARYYADRGDTKSMREFAGQVQNEKHLLTASVILTIAEAKHLDQQVALDRLDAWWQTTVGLRWNDPKKLNVNEPCFLWVQFMIDRGWIAEAELRLQWHRNEHPSEPRGRLSSLVARAYAKRGDIEACKRVAETYGLVLNNSYIEEIPYGLIDAGRVDEAADVIATYEGFRWPFAGGLAMHARSTGVMERVYGWIKVVDAPNKRAVACLEVLEAMGDAKVKR